MKRVALFYMFLLPGLQEDSWILSASSFNLLWYFGLAEVYEENLASHKNVVGKRRYCLIAFANNCGYSSPILHQNLTSGSFLKAVCHVGCEAISFVLPCSLSGFISCVWFYSMMHWVFRICWFTVTQILQILTYFIRQCQKITLVNIIPRFFKC